MLALLRLPRARLLFAVHAQSSLGTGAGYAALVVVAYERLESPWAIALVLLADFLPAMALGALLGAAADRWSRGSCAAVADWLRAAAFGLLPWAEGLPATLVLALVAGLGAGLFGPAAMAALPDLAGRERAPAATSLYGALADLGHTAGPVLAAPVLLLAGPEPVLHLNAASFALSALAMPRALGRGTPAGAGARRPSLRRETRAGLRAAREREGAATVILASGAVVLFAGMLNVGELLLATRELGVGASGFSLLVGASGLGMAAGSLAGARGGTRAALLRRYLAGILVVALGTLACAAAGSLPVAVVALAAVGAGNGLVLVHERLVLQEAGGPDLAGRLFGLRETVTAWGLAGAFLGGGALASLVGARGLFLVAGAGCLVVWAVALRALRGSGHERPGARRGLVSRPRPRPS
jgi:MFS family permease